MSSEFVKTSRTWATSREAEAFIIGFDLGKFGESEAVIDPEEPQTVLIDCSPDAEAEMLLALANLGTGQEGVQVEVADTGEKQKALSALLAVQRIIENTYGDEDEESGESEEPEFSAADVVEELLGVELLIDEAIQDLCCVTPDTEAGGNWTATLFDKTENELVAACTADTPEKALRKLIVVAITAGSEDGEFVETCGALLLEMERADEYPSSGFNATGGDFSDTLWAVSVVQKNRS